MLLIHPPIVKPCEPPPGIARLCGALRQNRLGCEPVDANLGGILDLLDRPIKARDTWTRRACRHLSEHLLALRSWAGYGDLGSYRRSVGDLGRLLDVSAVAYRARMSLGNYEHQDLSPTRSSDLIRAAQNPESNPFYPSFSKCLLELLDREQPSDIGFSLNYLSQALCAFAMIGFLKREDPRLTIIVGGGLVTSWMRRPGWKDPFQGLVDHLVAGPGEEPLLSFLGAERESGLAGKDGHYVPDYDSFPLGEYFAPGVILPYSASTGCYWNKCSFCPERAEGNRYLPVPIDKVVAQLRTLVNRYKPVLIHLTDNAISPALLRTIASNPPGASWYGFARLTHHLTDVDFCLGLKKSGCVMLKLGLESGDQNVLDQMQKGIDLEKASLALRSLKRAGISTYIYLLFGAPAESVIEARRTLEFVVRHRDQIDFLNLAIFNLPVYGPDTESLETRIFYEGDLSLYVDFDHPKGWSRKAVRQFLDKEFKRHPAIAPILRRDPPVFTSNHAPFFVMP